MARGPAGAEGGGGPALYAAHEEPVGDGGLDWCLESGVGLVVGLTPTFTI